MKKSIKVRTKNNITTLLDKHYKASGGQGAVFCKSGLAYKIYHDSKKMIPAAKIDELSRINRDNVLAPIEMLFDYTSNKPIGFIMKYIDGTEFLCKIFTRNFRDDKGINPNDIVDLVTIMQKTLQYIHALRILVVDYNEMNFLISNDMKNIFHIDVDAWQTKNFPANAIMESIRDRLVPMGTFTEFTDWYSWAIVTFQMYVGIHPYKGRHPDFKPKDWMKRMENGVSVFDSKVSLPDACQDFSVIPKKHLDWYKAIFGKNERSIPPFADEVFVSMAIIRTVASKGDFIVKMIVEFDKKIKNVFFFNGKRYVITYDGIYRKNLIFDLNKKDRIGMCDVFGEDPLVVKFQNNLAEFFDLKKQLVGSIKTENIMGYNGIVYTINNGILTENTFERIGKIKHLTKNICNIGYSYKVFKGVIIQDDFSKCRLAIPYEKGKCTNIRMNELDGQRIVDARYSHGICIVITEEQGNYNKFTICFDESHSNYTVNEEEVISLHSVNFIVLPNKMCISVDDEKLILFKDNSRRKEITNFPFDVSMRLYNDNMQVLFVNDKKLYSAMMKGK